MKSLSNFPPSASGASAIDNSQHSFSIAAQRPMTQHFPLPEKAFRSHAPGYWANKGVTPEEWNSHVWQLKNRVTTLAGLEEHIVLSEEERAGVLLSGIKLAMAITPHFFNLIPPTDPE